VFVFPGPVLHLFAGSSPVSGQWKWGEGPDEGQVQERGFQGRLGVGEGCQPKTQLKVGSVSSWRLLNREAGVSEEDACLLCASKWLD